MRIMGLDLGERTIGIAVSDEFRLTAQPVTVIRRATKQKDLDELMKLIEKHSVIRVVVGMPVRMDGSMGTQSKKVQRFIDVLKGRTEVPVCTWDERLSTVAVTRVLLEGEISRRRRKEVVDKMAASFILQGYLDCSNNNSDRAAE
jgi:putative Holliday junction resolvase